MMSQPSLEALYLAIAQLPYDASVSVQSLYDCLHYCCQLTAPELCWMLEYLSTGCLLVNSTARRMHTYAVKLVVYNFGMLIAHRGISDSTAPLPEFDHWAKARDLISEGKTGNYKLPELPLVTCDIDRVDHKYQWLKFLADPESKVPGNMHAKSYDFDYKGTVEKFVASIVETIVHFRASSRIVD